MTRGGNCGRCGGVRKGKSARSAQPVAVCSRCRYPICVRHARWDTSASETVCTACAEDHDLTVIKGVR
jgi:hypothetical protein